MRTKARSCGVCAAAQGADDGQRRLAFAQVVAEVLAQLVCVPS
jgi:hypothetical protein